MLECVLKETFFAWAKKNGFSKPTPMRIRGQANTDWDASSDRRFFSVGVSVNTNHNGNIWVVPFGEQEPIAEVKGNFPTLQILIKKLDEVLAKAEKDPFLDHLKLESSFQ